jgi:hypothetical protein
MKYVSIDIETTGLNREEDQILSIGLAIEDTNNVLPIEEIPKSHIIIPRERISGSPFALDLNKELISKIKNFYSNSEKDEVGGVTKLGEDIFIREGVVSNYISNFLFNNGIKFGDNLLIDITCAGKNFGTFDKVFLEKLPQWNRFIRIRQRILDPTPLLTDWKNDEKLPDLGTCKDRVALNNIVTHNALDDAIDIIEVMRKVTNSYKINFYEQ